MVTGGFQGGASVHRCLQLSKFLSKRDHEVYVAFPTSRFTRHVCRTKIEGVNSILLPRITFRRVPNFALHMIHNVVNGLLGFQLGRITRFDIIHGWAHYASTVISLFLLKVLRNDQSKVMIDWADLFGVGGLTTMRSKLVMGAATLVEQNLPLYVDGVTVATDLLKNYALSLGMRPERVFKFKTGVDTTYFRPIPKIFARKRLGLPFNKKIITFHGRYFTTRMLKLFLSLSDQLNKRFSNAILTVISSSEYARALRNRRNIIYQGALPYDDLVLFLAASDILLIPRDNALIHQADMTGRLPEYMAMGRPIVASNIGWIKEVINTYQCGLLAQPEDARDFSEQILRLMNNPELAEELSIRARRTAENYFAWEKVAEELESIYNIMSKA